jgi:hypothetical protein
MNQVTAERRRQQARDYIKAPNPITGNRKRHCGGSVDKQTDNGGKQSHMLMMMRLNYDDTLLTLFWGLGFSALICIPVLVTTMSLSRMPTMLQQTRGADTVAR